MASPIIPVTDERLEYSASAPKEHKVKVERYNEMLEDIYQRELELNTIKLSLIDMREQIAQEARIIEGATPAELLASHNFRPLSGAAHSDSSSNGDLSDGEQVLSDSGGSSKGITSFRPTQSVSTESKKVAKNIKTKAKGNRRSKIPDAQLGGDWDYKLELGRGAQARRSSDASEVDADDST